jgi:hypothetical protein
VLNIERKDITDNATTVELILPEQGKREKAVTAKEEVIALNGATGHHEAQTNASGTAGAGKLKRDSVIWQVYVQAKWIAEQGFFYWFGGGHASFGPTVFQQAGPEGNPPKEEGLDCSGLLSWALHSAHAWVEGEPPFDTQLFEKWGEPSEGKYITVWVADTVAQAHCFLWIQIPSALRPEGGPNIDYALEASHSGATVPAPRGVGLRPRTQYYPNPAAEGFKARHWPGT